MGLFSLMWMVIIGLVVGVVAKLLLPGKDPGGLIMTAVIGIAGSFVGTLIGQYVFHLKRGQSGGFILSVIGAIILLLLYRVIAGRQES